MSGVWVFRNGVVKLVENPPASANSGGGGGGGGGGGIRRKALLHMPTGEVVTSYASLERKLAALGWERYYSGGGGGAAAAAAMMLQFHKRSSVDLISLPKDFSQFGSVHMYDIVVKNRDAFRVIDV
uniref:Flowering-promoting factor 1-like protein 2 n=1 Tax=Oryza nivara TaxID=4536 RepID=A0A0E0IAX0_ORYNI